jgi:hypothetical protein
MVGSGSGKRRNSLSVIQELTKNPHESRGSPGVKLYLFAGIGKKPQLLPRITWHFFDKRALSMHHLVMA